MPTLATYCIPARVRGLALRALRRTVEDALRTDRESRLPGNEWLAEDDDGTVTVTITYTGGAGCHAERGVGGTRDAASQSMGLAGLTSEVGNNRLVPDPHPTPPPVEVAA